jgi:hypothetical protein
MTEGTAVWWTEQNSEDFAGLKARLPGPLRILDANAPLVPSVTSLPGSQSRREGLF